MWLRTLDPAIRFDGGLEGPDMELDERRARRDALTRCVAWLCLMGEMVLVICHQWYE